MMEINSIIKRVYFFLDKTIIFFIRIMSINKIYITYYILIDSSLYIESIDI